MRVLGAASLSGVQERPPALVEQFHGSASSSGNTGMAACPSGTGVALLNTAIAWTASGVLASRTRVSTLFLSRT